MRNIPSQNRNSFPIRLALLSAVAFFSALDATSVKAQTSPQQSQREALTQVGQALSRVVVKSKKVNEQLGYGFAEGASLFGIELIPGANAQQAFSLQAGQEYVFIGSGDKTARNIDIVLRDAKGRVMCQDTEPDAAPFIQFRPKTSGRFTLSLQLKSSWKGPVFCAFTVLRKGGTAVPFERIIEAAIRLDFACYDTFAKTGGGSFDQTPGGWALYGGVLRQGQSLFTGPKPFATGNHGIVAAGDKGVSHLDLAMLDSAGKPFTNMTAGAATPKIIRESRAGNYGVRVTNGISTGPALVMAVFLDLPPTPPPASTPVATPAAPVKLASFEGTWQGDIADPQKGFDGAFKMKVAADGTVSGHIVYRTLKLSAKFQGQIAPDGTLQLNYIQSKQPYLASGTITYPDERHEKAEGKLSFSTEDKVVGEAEFFLTRQK